ncbi:MAG: TlpA disulfide reductase family protein [Methylococcales bacterium]|nr:TlpA disulfide reductase family protein [Methylococcales bacterium]
MSVGKPAWRLIVALSLGMASASALAEAQAAPDCKLRSLSGDQALSLNSLQGQVVYVDFWASWCPPCLKSFPFMNDLQQRYRDQGLTVVAVNLDENLSDAQAFVEKQPAAFPVWVDQDQSCAQAFKVKAMPSTYLIDASGVIRHVHAGFRLDEAETLQAQVELLLTGSVDAR